MLASVPGLSEGYQPRISRTREVVSMRGNVDPGDRAFKKRKGWPSAQKQVHLVGERGEPRLGAPLRRQLQPRADDDAAVAEHRQRIFQRRLGERLEPQDAPGEIRGAAAVERLAGPLPGGHRAGEKEAERVDSEPDAFAEGPQELAEQREHARSARRRADEVALSLGQPPAQEQREVLPDRVLEVVPGREDELVLGQPRRLLRAPQQLAVRRGLAAEAAQRGGEDGGRDEEVEDAVLVIVERDAPLLGDRVVARPARLVPAQGPVGHQRLDGAEDERLGRIRAAVRAAVAGGGVKEAGALEDLLLRERALVVAEQHGAKKPHRRERRRRVDSRRDVEAEVLDDLLLFLRRAVLRIDSALAEELGEGDWLVDADGDAAIAAAQHLRRAEQCLGVLLPLLAALQLALVGGGLDHLFVGDADRGEV